MGTQVVEMTGDEAALLRSLQKVIDKQMEMERKLRDAAGAGDAAGTQIEAAMAKIQAEADKSLRGFLGDLRTLGPEGAAAAEAMKGHFIETGKAGHQSMETIIEQIRKLDPEAAAAAEQAASKIKDELGRAAQYSEGQFAEVLNELRQMGPEGKQAADQLRKELVAAGQIAEKSMADVVAQLEKISPEAAAMGRAIVANAQKGESAFAKFSKTAIAEVTAVAGAYIGISEAVELVNRQLEKQSELIKATRDEQVTLAQAQQDAIKNLVALTPDQRSALLQQVPTIAQETRFPDLGRITTALGEVASVGIDDPERIKSIVTQAARTVRLNPEDLDATASSAASVQLKTGLEDIRQVIALLQDTGAAARTRSQALAENLPKALATGVGGVPNQDRVEAARQTAAFFAQATTVGEDKTGQSAATFTIDFMARMDRFFKSLSDEQVQARSKIEVIDRKIASGSDTPADRLEKGRLSDFLTASEGVQDPGTVFGRLQILQRSESMAARFQGETGFGEKQFETFRTQVLTPNSEIAKNVQFAFEKIGADVGKFEAIAKELESSTSQLVLANASASQEATISASRVANTETGTLGAIRQITSTGLAEADPTGIRGMLANLFDFSQQGGLKGTTAAEEAVDAIDKLLQRELLLKSDGVQQAEAGKLLTLQASRESVMTTLQQNAAALDQMGLERAAAYATWLEQNYRRQSAIDPQNARLEQIFGDMRQFLQQLVESNRVTAENTSKTPPVTPALAGSQP